MARAWGAKGCNPLTLTPNHFDPLGRDRPKREAESAIAVVDLLAVRKPEGTMILICTRTPI